MVTKKKRLSARGRHTVLPIEGDTVCEVCLRIDRALALVFQADDGLESQLTIEDLITLRRGDFEITLNAIRWWSADTVASLSPLLQLLGTTVQDALAEHEGRLLLEFSNRLTLEITPSTDGEAWRFQSPRPGRPPGGDVSHQIAVSGVMDRLIG